MLQLDAVNGRTLELLKMLMSVEELQSFYLVGGTGLALYLGHRISYDLDFFTPLDFNPSVLLDRIKRLFECQSVREQKNTLNLLINQTRVQFLTYRYPLLNNLTADDKLLIASLEDIACMKISAIAGRGDKKDFYDLYFLLQRFSLKELLDMYVKKYSDHSLMHVVKRLVYFDDAESLATPKLLKEVDWSEVKAEIGRSVVNYLKIATAD